MRLFQWKAGQPNFGDEINAWLWPQLIPGAWDRDDDTLFVGIGTILDEGIPAAQRYVVFGSGTGFGRAPRDLKTERWRIYCVRGPLTARVLGLNASLAMSDPAILVRTLPEFAASASTGTVFVPHWTTALAGGWDEVCAMAEVEYLDPRTDSREVVARIAGAKLVLAESMHAAIIADAFRVPWIALASHNHIAPFKWQDWCLSVGIRYQPRLMPQAELANAVKLHMQESLAPLLYDAQHPFGQTLRAHRRGRVPDFEPDVLVEQCLASYNDGTDQSRTSLAGSALTGLKHWAWQQRHWLEHPVFAAWRGRARWQAARELKALTRTSATLSSDIAIQGATQCLLSALRRLQDSGIARVPASPAGQFRRTAAG